MQQRVFLCLIPLALLGILLVEQPRPAAAEPQPSLTDIVFSGSFEEVNRFFYEKEWSDDLPIVPPTIEKISEFLYFTERAGNESLGVVPPDNRSATLWAWRSMA